MFLGWPFSSFSTPATQGFFKDDRDLIDMITHLRNGVYNVINGNLFFCENCGLLEKFI